MFSVLFGLSMDYEVHLVSRIQEEWHHLHHTQTSELAALSGRAAGHNHLAITVGQARSGPIIAAAVGIMIVVFGSFLLGGQRILQEFGFGLGLPCWSTPCLSAACWCPPSCTSPARPTGPCPAGWIASCPGWPSRPRNRPPQLIWRTEWTPSEPAAARQYSLIWPDTVARAERLPEPALHERVDDEWSFVETLRHLVFITDAWANRTVEPMPYHRLGVTQTAYAPADAAALGIDLDARPSFAEVMTVRADRMALVRGIVAGLTNTELERICTRAPAPGYPEESRSVGDCLGVVMEEECEHHCYAVRDLAVLQAS